MRACSKIDKTTTASVLMHFLIVWMRARSEWRWVNALTNPTYTSLCLVGRESLTICPAAPLDTIKNVHGTHFVRQRVHQQKPFCPDANAELVLTDCFITQIWCVSLSARTGLHKGRFLYELSRRLSLFVWDALTYLNCEARSAELWIKVLVWAQNLPIKGIETQWRS